VAEVGSGPPVSGDGSVITQEKTGSSDSRFRRNVSGMTGHRLLGRQRPRMLCVAAWVWFCLTTECVESQG